LKQNSFAFDQQMGFNGQFEPQGPFELGGQVSPIQTVPFGFDGQFGLGNEFGVQGSFELGGPAFQLGVPVQPISNVIL
jgi:hypothetical protein